jgi:hypothetical protein
MSVNAKDSMPFLKLKADRTTASRTRRMKMKQTILTFALSGALAASCFAQVNARRENQQDRIALGIASGRLNAGEAANLERREHRLNQEIHRDRVAHDGRLTRAEHRQINRQQNRLSRGIYRDKHN